jgi:hypothetical protein
MSRAPHPDFPSLIARSRSGMGGIDSRSSTLHAATRRDGDSMAEATRRRTLRWDGNTPRARVSVRADRVSVEIWSISQAAELAIQLALAEGQRRAGQDACIVVGPYAVPSASPPKWYGRLALLDGDKRQLAVVRETAARVVREAGYLLLPETRTQLGLSGRR